jgi:hypothetical protein
MKWAWLGIAVLAVVGLLWIGGELHRQNCIEAQRDGCSVLPLDNGHSTGLRNLEQKYAPSVPGRAPGTIP